MDESLTCNAIAFPDFIDPIAFSIGPFSVHWYGLGYVVGILFAWWYGQFLLKKNRLWANNTPPMSAEKLGDFVILSVIGIVLGGRLGEVLFYNPSYYLSNPMKILAISDGGMSFHGGLVGMILAMIYFARKNKVGILTTFDTIAAGVPVGLGVVRLCNFINQELWGRPTDVAWAVCFPRDPDYLPRHPSQLYEAGLEGLILFFILAILVFCFKVLKRPGIVAGTFLLGYGLSRIIVEFFRKPTFGYIGTDILGDWLTMGIVLSLPMVIAGIIMILYAIKNGASKNKAGKNGACGDTERQN